MIILKLFGGLGNQMFQYSLYVSLKKRNKEVLLDGQMIDDIGDNHHRSSIYKSFNISKDPDIWSDDKKNAEEELLIRKALVKMKNDEISHYLQVVDWNYDRDILEIDDVYAEGYWQCERYFEDCASNVREAFKFKREVIENNKEMSELITQCDYPVSIHVREGDYNLPVNQKVFGGICTNEYYRSAIHFFKEKHPGCVFYVFSNDIYAAKERLGDVEAVFVDGNSETDGSSDMYLMSKCRGHIIANSSFSWWGAWLDERADKEIVSPDKWSPLGICKDIILDYFIRIRPDGSRV